MTLRQPLRSWLKVARSDQEVTGNPDFSLRETWPQPHNTINRQTGTTGEGQFALCHESDRLYPM